tara:strand:+ start:113 stop:613 length:501 start_codon:yes stop_codon:yes gene_type:complete
MGFQMNVKPGKKYGRKSKLIKKLNRKSYTDDITGMEVWKGLMINTYDNFVTLSGRYVRDNSEIYSFRAVFKGRLKQENGRTTFKVNSFVKRSHEADEGSSVERINLYKTPKNKKKSTLKYLSKNASKYEKLEVSLPVGSDKLNEYTSDDFNQFYEPGWHQSQELFG